MKYFLFSVFILMLFSSAIAPPFLSNGGKINFMPLKDKQICQMICASKNLACIGVLDKIVYDGETENAKILSKQTISVCLQYPEEFNPT